MPRHPEPHWRPKFGCYVYQVDGRRHYLRSIAKGDTAAAWRRVAEIQAGRDAERAGADVFTVDRLCAAYIAWSAANTRPRTADGHARILQRFCDFEHQGTRYGDRPAAEIDATDVGRMRRAWEKAGHARGYVAKIYASVLAAWAWAARPEEDRPEPLLEKNALAGLRRPSAPGRADRVATRDQLAAFLRAARRDVEAPWPVGTKGRCMACMRDGRPGPCRRNHAATTRMMRDTLVLLRLIGETGCRPGEACGARWEDWRPEADRDRRTGLAWGVLEVDHKNIRHTVRKRKLPVPPPLVRAIERIRAREGRHPAYLFTHRRGRGAAARGDAAAAAGSPWNTTALDARLRKWRAAAIAAGAALDGTFVPYALRHAYYSRTAPVLGAELAGLIGGTSGAVVRQVYLHSSDSALIEGARTARARRKGSGGE